MKYMREVRQTDAVEFRYKAEGDGLNEFRKEKFLVPLEKDLCGTIDCLNDPNNGLGFQIEVPSPRTHPWTPVRIYVQVDNLSAIDYVDAEITLDNSSYYTFLSKSCEKGGIGLVNNLEFPSFSTVSLSSKETFIIALNKNLKAPMQYKTIGFVVDGNAGDIRFWTEDIKDEDTNEPSPFMATSGTLTLESYGSELGDRIRGTFEVNLEGQQFKCLNSSCDGGEMIPITGTAKGKFDFTLRWHTNYFN